MRALASITVCVLIACGGATRPASDPAAPTSTIAPEPAPAPAPTPAAPTPPPIPEAPPWVAPPPQPHVVDVLNQVPAAARFVAGLDVPRLARGALASRFQSMLALFVAMGPASCAPVTIDAFDRVVMAGVGTKGEHVVFLGPGLVERVAGPCLADATIKKNGVTIAKRKEFGTTVYTEAGPAAGDGALAWTLRSGPIVVDRLAWARTTLDPNAPKASPALVSLASTADHARTFWVAALVDPDDVARLGLAPGTLTGPFTVRIGIDLDAAAEVDLDLVFSSEADARHAAEYIRAEAARAWREFPTQDAVPNLRLGLHGTEVRLQLHVDATAVGAFLKQLPLP